MAHVPPSVADFKAKFPGLASVPDATVQLALDETAARVDETWREADYAPARLYLAAHILTLDGHGAQAQTAGLQAQGLKSFKSGSMSAEFRSDAPQGSYAATGYGARFAALLEINAGGPLVSRAAAGEPSHLAHDWVRDWGWR